MVRSESEQIFGMQIDIWKEGNLPMVNISFVGDIMCYPRMTKIANGDYSELFLRAHKLKNCDYLVGNLETPIAGSEMKYTYERYCFNTPESFLTAIKKCGFNLVTLANNHCMDRGETGLVKTIENCKKAGLETIGTYATEEERNKVFVKEFNGIRVAFINYTYGTNAFAHHTFLKHPYMVNLSQPEETLPGSIHLLNSYEKIAEEVRKIYENGEGYEYVRPHLEQLKNDIMAAKEATDYVIMIMHNGGQHIREVDPYSIFLAEKIKEYGADIIVGHHQHLIQSCDTNDDYLKIFCLGNFINDQFIEGDEYYFDSPLYNAVFHLSLDKKEDGTIEAKKSFSIYTTVKNKDGLSCVIDAYDVYKKKSEPYLGRTILRAANLFAGSKRYTEIRERYEL